MLSSGPALGPPLAGTSPIGIFPMSPPSDPGNSQTSNRGYYQAQYVKTAFFYPFTGYYLRTTLVSGSAYSWNIVRRGAI
jgi:hypothetical protein